MISFRLQSPTHYLASCRRFRHLYYGAGLADTVQQCYRYSLMLFEVDLRVLTGNDLKRPNTIDAAGDPAML
jgi:hypothetical protein